MRAADEFYCCIFQRNKSKSLPAWTRDPVNVPPLVDKPRLSPRATRMRDKRANEFRDACGLG